MDDSLILLNLRHGRSMMGDVPLVVGLFELLIEIIGLPVLQTLCRIDAALFEEAVVPNLVPPQDLGNGNSPARGE